MEILTASATGFATIVGLLSNFKSERNSSSDDEYQEFKDWLLTKRHKDVLEELLSNHQLSKGIKLLLNQQHDVVLQKLAALDKTLILLSSSINGFKEITNAIAPNFALSDQALSILEQFDISGSSSFLECKTYSSTSFLFDGSGKLQINEPRFVDDDLIKLVDLQLLNLDYNSKNNRIFRITRLASKLLEQCK